MRPRRGGYPVLLAAIVPLLFLTVACAPAPPVAGPAPGESTAPVVLELPAPPTIDWRRTVAGIEVAGARTEPDPAELALLARALDELPAELLAAARPRRIYRIPEGEKEGDASAYSIGPDVYLIDRSFPPASEGFVTFDLVRLLAHELTHVAQYRALEAEGVAAGDGDPILSTAFVSDFAREVGWRDSPEGDRRLADPSGATRYGATSPSEDMADAVAEVVTGFGEGVDEVRIRWVERWLGAPAVRLAGGRPWVPPGSTRFRSDDALYDEAAVAAEAPGVVETLTFGLPDDFRSDPVAALVNELRRRGVRGSFAPVADDRVARIAGTFHRGDGVGYRIELWDFRRAPGFVDPPDRVVVTYVVEWP